MALEFRIKLNLEMMVFEENGKHEYLEKQLMIKDENRRVTNSSHIRCKSGLSPLPPLSLIEWSPLKNKLVLLVLLLKVQRGMGQWIIVGHCM